MPSSGSGPPGFWVRLIRGLAVGYLVALVVVMLALRLVGERWWVTTIALYLPRAGFALPLPFLVVALLWVRPRRWLLTQALAAILVVFPLMGLHLSLPRSPSAGATRLRVLSFNINAGFAGVDALAAEIGRANADIMLLQENWHGEGEALQARFPGFHFNVSGQFVLLSRYPILDVSEPPKLPIRGQERSARYMRYRVELPGGTVIQLYNLHPLSPREAFEDLRGDGFKTQLKSGRFFLSAKGRASLAANAELRTAQVAAAAADAHRSSDPVLLAGDTNLPGLSWALARSFGGFQDGYAQVGNGFGYTFPRPWGTWMRIDRVMADQHFRFLAFTIIKDKASDHLAVVADLELAQRDTGSTARGDH